MPSHATMSSIGFEQPMELSVEDPTGSSGQLNLRILDLAGQECYGILHTFLMTIGNPRNLISLIVVNALLYFQSISNLPKEDTIVFMKHCGVWLNSIFSINQFAVVHIILSHTDLMMEDDVLAVMAHLRKNAYFTVNYGELW